MSINLPLDQMSVAEKLQAMEAIWVSLCANPTDVPSPAWHEQILADRKRRLDSGDTMVADWAAAKKRLQNLGR